MRGLIAPFFCFIAAVAIGAENPQPDTAYLVDYVFSNGPIHLDSFDALRLSVKKNGAAEIFNWERGDLRGWHKIAATQLESNELRRLQTELDKIDFIELAPYDHAWIEKMGGWDKVFKMTKGLYNRIDYDGASEWMDVTVAGKKVRFKELGISTMAQNCPDFAPIQLINRLMGHCAEIADRSVGKNDAIQSIRNRRKPADQYIKNKELGFEITFPGDWTVNNKSGSIECFSAVTGGHDEGAFAKLNVFDVTERSTLERTLDREFSGMHTRSINYESVPTGELKLGDAKAFKIRYESRISSFESKSASKLRLKQSFADGPAVPSLEREQPIENSRDAWREFITFKGEGFIILADNHSYIMMTGSSDKNSSGYAKVIDAILKSFKLTRPQ